MIRWNDTKAEKALHTAALEAFGEAKRVCPVRTGRLRDSIMLEVSGERAVVSANTEYAVAVECGYGRRAPNPFMEIALMNIAKKVPEIYLDEIFGERRAK